MSLHETALRDLIDSACRACAGTGRLHSRVAQALPGGDHLPPVLSSRDCPECQGSGFSDIACSVYVL